MNLNANFGGGEGLDLSATAAAVAEFQSAVYAALDEDGTDLDRSCALKPDFASALLTA